MIKGGWKMTLYRVVWDEEFNGNCHDEILTNWTTLEKAKEFIDKWVSERIKRYGIPCSEENISALSEQLSYETKEMNLEVNLSKRIVSNIMEFLENHTKLSKDTLEQGFGNPEYTKKGIEENNIIWNALHNAKELGLKAKIVFEEK